MATATITSKGQVTLPKSIRDSLSLKTGDKIEITTQGKKAVIKPITATVDDTFGILKQDQQNSVSVDAMHDAITQRLKSKNNQW